MTNEEPSRFCPPVRASDKVFIRLIFLQRVRGIGKFARLLLNLRGIDIPPQTLQPGTGLILRHSGNVVVHSRASLGRNIALYQGVTIGRGDIWRESDPSFEGFIVEDDVVLAANAVVVSSRGTLRIGRGTILGANSVLTQSTGNNEIWAGTPAKRIGMRHDGVGVQARQPNGGDLS